MNNEKLTPEEEQRLRDFGRMMFGFEEVTDAHPVVLAQMQAMYSARFTARIGFGMSGGVTSTEELEYLTDRAYAQIIARQQQDAKPEEA